MSYEYWETAEFKKIIDLPCGAQAMFDYDSGIAYRCMDCFTIWGSISNPCYKKYNLIDTLRGKNEVV